MRILFIQPYVEYIIRKLKTAHFDKYLQCNILISSWSISPGIIYSISHVCVFKVLCTYKAIKEIQ